MLNKGPHVVEALRFLNDVLSRMHQHQNKRTPMLRALSVATREVVAPASAPT